MKFIIISLLFSANAFAQSYYPVGKSGDNRTVYGKKSDCESKESWPCEDIGGKDLRYWDETTVQVDDVSNPIYKAEYNVEACDIEVDCMEKLSAKTDCTNDPADAPTLRENTLMPGWSVVCTQVTGYEQKDKVILIENAAVKSSLLAADAAKIAQQDGLSQAKAARKFGESILDMMAVKNVEKSLSKGQIKQVVQDYELVRQLLVSGAVATARDEIAAMVPDGARVTQADKDDILAALDAYLGQ